MNSNLLKMVWLIGFCWMTISSFAQMDSTVQKLSDQRVLMGSAFSISVVSADSAFALNAIEKGYDEIERIERLISSWDTNSQTSKVNNQAGIQPVQVDFELFALIYRCQKISKLTEGAFDISYASMNPIWKFDGSMTSFPDSSVVQRSIEFVGYENIVLNREDTTVFLKHKEMKIGFGAIGKGYAANRVMFIMKKLGVTDGLVNAGGDLIAWGKDERNQDWGVAIADPDKQKKILAWLTAYNTSIVTSGDYEKFIEFDGKRYGHIIDPATGYPSTGIKSVTIVWFDAELADALATSVFVLGKEKGLALINEMDGVECLIITDQNELITSKNLTLQIEK